MVSMVACDGLNPAAQLDVFYAVPRHFARAERRNGRQVIRRGQLAHGKGKGVRREARGKACVRACGTRGKRGKDERVDTESVLARTWKENRKGLVKCVRAGKGESRKEGSLRTMRDDRFRPARPEL